MRSAKSRSISGGLKGTGAKLSGAPRLERSVLSQQVSSVVMKGLLEGRLEPGDRLVENDLANLLGVSRSPIREALAELSQSGVVVRETGRGSRIRQWTKQDLEDLFGVRSVLEGYAARLVAGRVDPKSRKALEKIISRMRNAGNRGDFAGMIDLDLEFHTLLWQLSGNPLLQMTLEGLSQQFRLFLTMNWKFHGGLTEVADNHVRVLDALLQGVPAVAEEAMHHHVVVEEMVSGLAGHHAAAARPDRSKRAATAAESQGVHR